MSPQGTSCPPCASTAISVDLCPDTQGAVPVGSQSLPHLTGEGSPCSCGAETWARMFTTPEVTLWRDGAVLEEQDGHRMVLVEKVHPRSLRCCGLSLIVPK